MVTSTLLLNVARDLRYRSLDDLIGHEVRINDRLSIVPELLAFVSRFIDGCVFQGDKDPERDFRTLAGPIGKYGILDVQLNGPASLLDQATHGVSLLRDLGFLPDDRGESTPLDDDPEDCLRELRDGVAERRTYVLLFLETSDAHIVDASFSERLQRIKDPSLIEFPITFTVSDACVTNSSFVWINKHFYL